MNKMRRETVIFDRETSELSERTQELRRKSGGFLYWLLVPLGWHVFFVDLMARWFRRHLRGG